MAKAKFTTNSRLEGVFDKPVEFGQVVELDEKAAAELVACGALIPAAKPQKADKAEPAA